MSQGRGNCKYCVRLLVIKSASPPPNRPQRLQCHWRIYFLIHPLLSCITPLRFCERPLSHSVLCYCSKVIFIRKRCQYEESCSAISDNKWELSKKITTGKKKTKRNNNAPRAVIMPVAVLLPLPATRFMFDRTARAPQRNHFVINLPGFWGVMFFMREPKQGKARSFYSINRKD